MPSAESVVASANRASTARRSPGRARGASSRAHCGSPPVAWRRPGATSTAPPLLACRFVASRPPRRSSAAWPSSPRSSVGELAPRPDWRAERGSRRRSRRTCASACAIATRRSSTSSRRSGSRELLARSSRSLAAPPPRASGGPRRASLATSPSRGSMSTRARASRAASLRTVLDAGALARVEHVLRRRARPPQSVSAVAQQLALAASSSSSPGA